MSTRLALLAVAAILTASASPAFAAKSGPNTGTRGQVNVSLSNSRTNPALCTVKVAVKNVAPSQTIYLGSQRDFDNTYIGLGGTDGNGVFLVNNSAVSRDDYNNSYALILFTDSFAPILDVANQPVGYNISNSCAPAP